MLPILWFLWLFVSFYIIIKFDHKFLSKRLCWGKIETFFILDFYKK